MSKEGVFSEIFGPTLQGEGPFSGRPAFFLRMGGCNLDCYFCDSAYTWDFQRFPRDFFSLDVPSTWKVLSQLGLEHFEEPLVVLTGGEPLLQSKFLLSLIREGPDGVVFQFETNGTLPPLPKVEGKEVYYVVSPKHPRFVSEDKDPLPLASLLRFADLAALGEAWFKFVVSAREDAEWALALAGKLGVPFHRVYLMPEGVTSDELLKKLSWLFPFAAQNGVSLSLRLQILAFGNRRGV